MIFIEINCPLLLEVEYRLWIRAGFTQLKYTVTLQYKEVCSYSINF